MESTPIADLLAQRAEEDARRWEKAAVEMERQRNEAKNEVAVMRGTLERERIRLHDAAKDAIDRMDEATAAFAKSMGIPIPPRGECPYDHDLD